jgi:hypothetical protein
LRFGIGLFDALGYGQLIGAANRHQHGDGRGENQVNADFERERHLRQSILLFGGSVKFCDHRFGRRRCLLNWPPEVYVR